MRLLKSALFIERLRATFGPRDTARLYLARARAKLRVSGKGGESSSVVLTGFSAPLHLRFATSDWNVLEQIFISKEYEAPTAAHAEASVRCYQSILDRGQTPVIIDCGANVGLAALWYARTYPEAKIFCVEPEIDNFKILQKNVSAYPGIVPIHAAVAGSKGRLSLANETGSPWAWTTTRSENGDVSSVTINDILHRCDGGSAFIVKVDIEGFEVDLFSRNTEWIADFPIIVAETHDYLFPWKGTAHAVFAALVSQGVYDFVQKGENCFCYAHSSLKPLIATESTPTDQTLGNPASEELRAESTKA